MNSKNRNKILRIGETDVGTLERGRGSWIQEYVKCKCGHIHMRHTTLQNSITKIMTNNCTLCDCKEFKEE